MDKKARQAILQRSRERVQGSLIHQTYGDVLQQRVQKDSSNGDTVRYLMTLVTDGINRHGSSVKIQGMRLENYIANPGVYYQHDTGNATSEPIGKMVDVAHKGDKIQGLMEFVDFDERAARLQKHLEFGSLNSMSVGFMPEEMEELNADDEDAYYGEWYIGGYHYTLADMLENSLVTIPADAFALREQDIRQALAAPWLFNYKKLPKSIRQSIAPLAPPVEDKVPFEVGFREALKQALATQEVPKWN